jgi:hypothetical protein
MVGGRIRVSVGVVTIARGLAMHSMTMFRVVARRGGSKVLEISDI